jgi:SAM-dependent methyltransferase
MSARLRSALRQLPLAGMPARALDIGCGANAAANVLHDLLPGWTFYGIDIDHDALKHAQVGFPAQYLIQADARTLPGLFRACFGLIVLRHPDLYRHRAAWKQIIPVLPALLAPGGSLLIALYAPEEVELIRGLPLPPPYPLNGLAPVNLAGQDRYLLVFRPEP